jgi:hypothetical protein
MAFRPGSLELAYCTASDEYGAAIWLASLHGISDREWPPHQPHVRGHLLYRAPPGVSLSGPLWWSCNGAKLALHRTENDTADLVSIDVLSHEMAPMLHDTRVVELVWEPSGALMCYATETDGHRSIWLQTDPPDEPRHLGEGGFGLRWSVDGTLRWSSRAEEWTRFTWSSTSEEVSEERTFRLPSSASAWSPDGKYCAGLTGEDRENPSLAIYAINSATTDLVPLPGAGAKRVLCWSPDSRLILILGQDDHLLAVSARAAGPGVVALADAKGPGSNESRLLTSRASLLGFPIIDPSPGPPAWTWSFGSYHLAYVIADEATARESYPRFGEGTPLGEIVVERMDRTFVAPPNVENVERMQVTQNMKNVALAIQMYLADSSDVFPPVAEAEGLVDILSPYVRDRGVLMRPGSEDEVSFWYVVPAGLKLTAVREPTRVPVAIVDYDPRFLVVAYANGHVTDLDRTRKSQRALEAWLDELQRAIAEDPTAPPPAFVPPE